MRVLIESRQGGALVKSPLQHNEAFTIPGQGLYAWVPESRFKLFKNNGLDEIKFGQYGANASNGTTPQDTILSYVGTTTEAIIILWAHRLTDEELKRGNAYEIEHMMQPLVGPKSKDGKSTEVFYTSVDKIQSAFSDIVYNTKNKLTYPPRLRQQEAIDKMISCFNNGEKDFLLGAIMRYGKNFTYLTTAKNIVKPGGNILILTNKPGVFSSLKQDIESHAYFNDWEYIELKEDKDFIPDLNKVTVIAVSKQLTDNKKSGKKVRARLNSLEFTTAFFDECHSGTDTDTFKKLISTLKINFTVWASGTPFKALASQGFRKETSYIYGYLEQQNDKRNNILPDAVTLHNYIISVNPELNVNPNFTDDEGFTLTKLLATDNEGRFIFGGEVRTFISDVLGVSNNKSKYSPYRICQGSLDHTLWLLPPDVKMIESLGKLINDITDEYEVFVASGNNCTKIQDIHDVIKLGNKKTITLTNLRFIEGTTVPEWNGAFVMSDTESVEKYFQFIFRVASPNKNKDVGYVFDFSPERSYQMMFEFVNAHVTNNEQTDTQGIMKEWLDNYPIFRAGDGPTFRRVQIEEVLEVINNGDYRAATLTRSVDKYLNYELLRDVMDEFYDINTKKNIQIKIESHTNNTTKGKNYTLTGRGESTQSELNLLKEAAANISGIISTLPLLTWITDLKTVEDINNECDEEIFNEFTGVSKQMLGLILKHKLIDLKFVNLYL
jgi:hypothetical protein